MDRLRQDLIVALRRLRKTPGFTLAAIVTLALGIGANTAIFTAVNTLIFQPLPVDHPKELVSLNTRIGGSEFPVQSYPNYLDLRDRNQSLAGLAGYRPVPVNFSLGASNRTALQPQGAGNESRAARIWAYEVTGNYFDMLGVKALAGRVIEREDDTTRLGHPVAVITYATWQQRFGGDPSILGGRVKLNGMDYTIVGVTPRGFSGSEVVLTPEMFVPLAMEKQIEPDFDWLDRRSSQNLALVGRLKQGVTSAQAEAELNVLAAEMGHEYPRDDAGLHITLSPIGLFGNMLRGPVEGFAAVLMGVAGLVLLIACVNLASLLLARAADRRRDTAIRLALGAARTRLIRQLLTESLLLAVTGGVLGTILAKWLADLLSAWRLPMNVPIVPSFSPDWRVMVFAIAISIFTGVVFGLAPALQSTRAELAPALKNEAVADRLRRFQLRDVLVAAQVALSVVLLVGSVLVVRSLQHALDLKLGLDPRHAASVSFDTSLQGYDESHGREFQRRLLEKVRAIPGIEAAGTISGLPLTMSWNNSGVFIEGKPAPKAADVPLAAMFDISPGYLRAAGTRLIAGRDFDETDKEGARPVALVNEAFARQLLPGGNPIGKRFRHSEQKGDWIEIVGVVEDGKYRSLNEKPNLAAFRPFAQDANGNATMVARSSLPEEQIGGLLRRAVTQVDATMPVYDVGSLEDQLGLVLMPSRIAAVVLGAFGLLAIVLAATGVYGIMAYAVARRAREIGIRMALGAKPAQVLRVVLMHTAILVLAGTICGIALSLAAGRVFALIVYGVSTTDPVTYALAIGLMAAVAMVAAWFPVRRAMAVDPVTALRTE